MRVHQYLINNPPATEITIDNSGNAKLIYETLNNSNMETHKILVSDEALAYVLLINLWGLGQCVTILGLIVNVLNIMTFVKQGVRDPVNISLLGLTISDLGSLVFLFLVNLCWTPAINKLDLPFYPKQMMYFFTWTHLLFTRVTTGTTAWIAFERCLCIVAPLKIKSIITPRISVLHICVLYVIMISAVAPIFYTSRPTFIYDSIRNKSILGFVKITNSGRIDDVAYIMNNTLPTVFFVFIVACTAVLVKTLQSKAKWRKQATSLQTTKDKSKKDTQVSKMVLIISIVFILCYAPGAITFIGVIIHPELKIGGKQKNVTITLFTTLSHLQSINATANFFIYIKMSSKFRSTFQQLFCFRSKTQTQINKKYNRIHRLSRLEQQRNDEF